MFHLIFINSPMRELKLLSSLYRRGIRVSKRLFELSKGIQHGRLQSLWLKASHFLFCHIANETMKTFWRYHITEHFTNPGPWHNWISKRGEANNFYLPSSTMTLKKREYMTEVDDQWSRWTPFNFLYWVELRGKTRLLKPVPALAVQSQTLASSIRISTTASRTQSIVLLPFLPPLLPCPLWRNWRPQLACPGSTPRSASFLLCSFGAR